MSEQGGLEQLEPFVGEWSLEMVMPDQKPMPDIFTGTFSQDGKRIDGTWEIAHDKKTWEKDFDLNYIRVR